MSEAEYKGLTKGLARSRISNAEPLRGRSSAIEPVIDMIGSRD